MAFLSPAPIVRRGVGYGGGQLAAVAASLAEVGNPERITGRLRTRLGAAARPLAPAVRAAILDIPTTGTKHTGLRARIASCVIPWANVHGDVVSVGVEVQPRYMPDGQKGLPLYMEGVNRHGIWQHPFFGDMSLWYSQAAHPYFDSATAWYSPVAQQQISRVLDDMTRTLEAAAAAG